MYSAKQLPTQLCRFEDGRIHSGFVIWQHIYADYGIPTFPVKIEEDEKKPLVRGYLKVWPDLSTKWAQQFPFAPTFGLVLGPKKWRTDRHGKTLPPASGIAELDIDSHDERILADALIRHGYTPIVIRTASRKFKLWYRHNGERRRIRPWPGLPIDLLGGGYTVAPPSFSPCLYYQQYEFIQGGLDDIGSLPVMVNLEAELYAADQKRRSKLDDSKALSDNPMRGMREGDGRNEALRNAIAPPAREIHAVGGTRDALLDVALSLNADCLEPMSTPEVSKIVNSVWKWTIEGHNHIGQHGAFLQDYEVDDMIGDDNDALMLLLFLRRHQGPDATFWITNGLAETFGWRRQRLADARKRLIERGLVRPMRQIGGTWPGHAAEYRWANGKTNGVQN
jgi:Bifunctional DNA primase/polymerase, N-terminal